MESTANRIFAFFVVLCFCITAPSCRTMKKRLSKEKTKTEESSQTREISEISKADSSRKRVKEMIEFQFEFGDKVQGFPDPGRGSKKGQLANEIQSQAPENMEIPLEAWEALLSRVKTLSVKIQREEDQELNILETAKKELEQTSQKETESEVKNLDKSSDSTLGANIPWYAWIIGALLIFGIVVYCLKQIRPV